MVQCPQFYTAVVFALHPENILSAAYKFGSSSTDIYGFKPQATTVLNCLKVQLSVNTEDLSNDVIDTASNAEYDREMHRIRRGLEWRRLKMKTPCLSPRETAKVPQASGEVSRIGCPS
ncbi:hypothetical protein F443_00331 [Phytophthora nicotianae P1569]|uniref:Uncharacterized protein n=1 Tax=Phytophthora nicotianae P1569 TaxID=1317065 RepID=V9G2I6_PHYNI|nr:hypothetical protein F443_00331 [Phytophthora nicotianae P1569]